jgi:hypothetical protein
VLACLALVVPLLVAAGSGSGHAEGAAPTTTSTTMLSPDTASIPAGELEANLTGNGGNMHRGEPEIAVNPKNPNQLFVDGATFPVPLVFNGQAPIPYTCGGWFSANGGLSWRDAAFPQTGCEDGVAAFGPDGTLYAGGDVASSVTIVPAGTPGTLTFNGATVSIEGYDPIYKSTDGGRTWSPQLKVIGSANQGNFDFAAGSGTPINTFDRPWLVVDQSTNTVYMASHNISDHKGFVTASTDEAESFGPIYAMDSPDYPAGGFGGNIAAARGIFAAVYSASAAPGATCPCLVFATSTDHGKTFTRHVVPTSASSSGGKGEQAESALAFPYITADPTTRGHFALTILDSNQTANEVFVTHDSGKTWQGPAVVAEKPANPRFKPWIAYGPTGQLALMWRTRYADGSFDVWSALSRREDKQGPVFGTPVRTSSVAGAYPKSYQAGDDVSFVALDGKYAHVGWGDARNVASGAGVQIWYGRVPLSSYKKG